MVRYKTRYILCKVIYSNKTRQQNLRENVFAAVTDAVKMMHGDYAIASLQLTPSIRVQYLDTESRIVLIKCQHTLLKIVQSSISFIKKLGNEEAFFQTIHVGGTIRSSLKFLIRYHKSRLPMLLAECKTEEEKQQVQEAIARCCRNSTQKIKSFEGWDKKGKPKT